MTERTQKKKKKKKNYGNIPYSFNSVAYDWVRGEKTIGPIAKKCELNFGTCFAETNVKIRFKNEMARAIVLTCCEETIKYPQ
jgi:hypothetical protein